MHLKSETKIKKMINQIKKRIEYFIKAKHKGGHGIHSPFVFELTTGVIENNKLYYAYEYLADIRYTLGHDKTIIEINDLGAGAEKNASRKISIKDVLHKSTVSPKYAKLLFRLVNHFQPQHILELGTSVGVSTACMAFARKKTDIYTIEGCQRLSAIAQKVFEVYNLKNIHQFIGNFDNLLADVLNEMKTVDFAFIDGNHRYEPTLRYFKQILPYTHSNTVLIFDDIYWSEEMTKAWNEIKKHNAVSLSIDLFQFGIVFFRTQNKETEHFCIRF